MSLTAGPPARPAYRRRSRRLPLARQHQLDALGGDLVPGGSHAVDDAAQADALGPECPHLPQGYLLLGDRHQLAVLAHPPAERHGAAEITAPPALVLLHFGDPLTNAVPLGLGDGGEDGEHQLADAVG